MIGRIVNVVLVLGRMIGGAVVTYNLKHQTEKAAARVARLHTKIAQGARGDRLPQGGVEHAHASPGGCSS